MHTTIYPWQQTIWQHLHQEMSRMPHALILHGKSGIGKYDFALALSKSLLCQNKNAQGFACGECASCHWFHDKSHPDFRVLSPEQESDNADADSAKKKVKKKTQISITQVRELHGFLTLTSHQQSGLRIVFIHPAEALNPIAANALLKMLEEPAPRVIFILVAHYIQRLLPTILSRCQKIAMPMPDHAHALSWLNSEGIAQAEIPLAYHAGCPLKVKDEMSDFALLDDSWRLLAQGSQVDPKQIVAKLLVNSAEAGMITLQKWLYDVVAIRHGGQVRYHLAHANALQGLADKVNLSAIFDLQKKLDGLRKLALHPLNHELQLESLLFDYIKLFSVK